MSERHRFFKEKDRNNNDQIKKESADHVKEFAAMAFLNSDRYVQHPCSNIYHTRRSQNKSHQRNTSLHKENQDRNE